MRHTGAAGVALAIVMMAGAFGASEAGVEQDLMDRIRADALAASGGDLSRVGGTVTTYGVDGPVMRAIDGHEFLALAARVTAGLDPREREPRDHAGPTFGTGSAYLAATAGVSPCEAAFMFTYYFVLDPPSIRARVPLGPGTTTDCNRPYIAYGESATWGAIVMVPPPAAFYSCGGAALMTPHPGGATEPGPGLRCGATRLVAHGDGVLFSLGFFGLVLDYFLGTTAHITMEG